MGRVRKREAERVREGHCYKELAHMTMEVGKSKIFSIGWQPRDSGELMV